MVLDRRDGPATLLFGARFSSGHRVERSRLRIFGVVESRSVFGGVVESRSVYVVVPQRFFGILRPEEETIQAKLINGDQFW